MLENVQQHSASHDKRVERGMTTRRPGAARQLDSMSWMSARIGRAPCRIRQHRITPC